LVYDGVKSDAEVLAIHTAMIAGSGWDVTNLVGDWTMRKSWGTQTLVDQVNGYNIVFGGSAALSATLDPNWGGGQWVQIDLGVGNSRAPDFLFVDRGHNLFGGVVALAGSDDAIYWPTDSIVARTVPAQGTTSGDPTLAVNPSSAPCVTEDSSAPSFYSLFTALPARRIWRFYAMPVRPSAPAVPGVIAGVRHQLAYFSSTFDPDAGQRQEPTERSRTGWKATDTVYAYRRLELGLELIDSTYYDSIVRDLRRLLFAKNQPVVVAMDYGSYPERAWCYQYEGAAWNAPLEKALRKAKITLVELGAAL
jgi:hypothetical protein